MFSSATLSAVTWSSLPWARILGIAWGIHIVLLAIWIILQKRSPVATLSWIISLAFFPYLGFIIYHFIGPQKLRRQHYRRLLAQTTLLEHRHLHALRAQAMAAGAPPSPMMRQLTRLVSHASGFPVTTAASLQLLADGAATYNAIFEAIREARHHVHLEYYIYEPDNIGTALRDLLITKAREGVHVRLLVDGIGSTHIRTPFIAPLLEAGGEFAFFHPIRFSQFVRPLLNLRTHRKIVVCDGKTGFTGGLNITDEEDERTQKHAYHDIHIRLTGNAVHSLQLVFLEDWLYATGQATPFDTRSYFPEQPPGNYAVQVLASGPDSEWEIIHRLLLDGIHAAQKRIWLITPYFVPTEAALIALTSAALRGIDVRLLLPRRSDSRFVTAAARSYFDELIRAGVKIWEYDGRMLHAKTMVIDAHFSLVGTANFDARSFRLNFEVCAVIYDTAMNQDIARQFEIGLGHAQAVPQNRSLHFPARLFEASARLLSPLL
ncbi:MAG: cardiolipin synthase [Burkholderiaceae bacterium]|jgi:cardiolipin synthase|nr:cardiolipin synthase [Burkholderiaceae bacterium]